MTSVLVGAYVLFIYLTFVYAAGAYIASRQLTLRSLVKSTVFALAWPLYWPILHGTHATLLTLTGVILTVCDSMRRLFLGLLQIIVFDSIKTLYTATIALIADLINVIIAGSMSLLKNIVGTSTQILHEITAFLNAGANVYFYIALVIVPAVRLYETWDRCTGWCALVIVQAFLWGLAWPVYLIVRFTNLLG